MGLAWRNLAEPGKEEAKWTNAASGGSRRREATGKPDFFREKKESSLSLNVYERGDESLADKIAGKRCSSEDVPFPTEQSEGALAPIEGLLNYCRKVAEQLVAFAHVG